MVSPHALQPVVTVTGIITFFGNRDRYHLDVIFIRSLSHLALYIKEINIFKKTQQINGRTCFDDDDDVASVFILVGDRDEAGLTAIGCGLFVMPKDTEEEKKSLKLMISFCQAKLHKFLGVKADMLHNISFKISFKISSLVHVENDLVLIFLAPFY